MGLFFNDYGTPNDFSSLSTEAQHYIDQRFARHGIDGEEAFNNPIIFPEELKNLPEDDLISLLEKKHISHIYPKSEYPELADKLENIVLEDATPNIERGANKMTSWEYDNARLDLKTDIIDGDIDEDGILDLEGTLNEIDNNDILLDILGPVIPIGLVMSGMQTLSKIKKKEISLNEVPEFFTYHSGEKVLKCAIIGILLTTGQPIIVSGTIGCVLYRSRNFIKSSLKGIYTGITSQHTYNFLVGSGRVVMATGKFGGVVINKTIKGTVNVATHKITKNSLKGVFFHGKNLIVGGVKITGIVIKGTGYITKKGWLGIKKLRSKNRA